MRSSGRYFWYPYEAWSIFCFQWSNSPMISVCRWCFHKYNFMQMNTSSGYFFLIPLQSMYGPSKHLNQTILACNSCSLRTWTNNYNCRWREYGAILRYSITSYHWRSNILFLSIIITIDPNFWNHADNCHRLHTFLLGCFIQVSHSVVARRLRHE